ncbi:hypothetical protein HPF16_0947 [Helicobacter pylori F16]|nr:hypothetical protein HPF16_0947 [Helicobacter pylori F16]
MIESFDYPKEKALEEIKALDLSVKDIEKTYEKLRGYKQKLKSYNNL